MTREMQVAVGAARDAGARLREAFGRPRQITAKRTAIDLVTEMDRTAETIIVERLRTVFPDYGLLTEERPAVAGIKNARWIVDPLDGTTNYIHGYPFFAVSIALEREGQLTLGVVYNPLPDELFVAEKGHGATLNGHSIRVSQIDTLQKSLLTSGFPYNAWESEDDNNIEWHRFLKRTMSLRCIGSTALDLCYVACGRVDGYWEHGLGAWDIAGGALIAAEAGARVTDYQGDRNFLSAGHVVAATPRIHKEMLAVLQTVRTHENNDGDSPSL